MREGVSGDGEAHGELVVPRPGGKRVFCYSTPRF
jgi:hypothetical protein